MWPIEPYVVSDRVTLVPHMRKTPKWMFTYSNGLVWCVKNRNSLALIFREIYRFDFYAIYININPPAIYNYIYINPPIFPYNVPYHFLGD